MEDRRPQLLPLISESAKHLSLPRMKLLCSYAGKLLARPDDGRLRYSGGEKRIIAVNRDITYSDLMLRVLEIYGQTVELKYQPLDEDPDALVSLRSDEDIANMMDEHDLKRRGSRIRVFLLSSIDQPQGDSSKEQTNSSFPSESVGSGLTSDAVKSCKSATSDRLRELDARSPSSIPSLSSDALSSLERQSQLSFNLTTSQTRLQSDSVERSLSSCSISETPLKQTALSGCSSSICSKEQACVTSRVQLPCSSAENKYFDSQRLLHWLSSGTEDDAAEQCLQSSSVASAEVAKLEQCATNSQEVLSKLSSSAPISNHKVAPIHTFESLAPENQVETLAAESHSLINPNIDNSEDINATKCFTPGDVDAQQESLKSSQCLASFSIVGCKTPDKQHHKYLIDWQVVSSLPLHDLDSQVRSVSLAPPVGRLEIESYVGIPQPNDDKSKSVWSSNPLSLTVDILSSPQELICRQQDFASANNTLLNVVGAFDTVTVTHHHDLENMLTSTVIVPDYPAQMEAGSFLEHQQIAEPNTLSLPEDKKNQPVTSGDQQDKVFLSKVHPTHHVQTSNLPSEEGKEMDLIGFCLQRERNTRDDLNMLGKTDAGLIEPNYLDLKSTQQLEAFHDVRAKMTNFNGNMHLTSVNLIAQCTEAHNEQLENRLGSNDLVPENSYFGPEKHPLLPSVLELNKLDAKLSYPVLAKSRSLDKVGTLEKLQTSCIGLPTSVDLAPENLYHELRTANLMREAQTVENILAGAGAMSKNSPDKDEYLQCKETIKKDVQLRKTVLNESYAESTAEANVIAPPICMPSTIATKTFTMNISPLLCSSKIENKVDSCHSGREDLQEGLNDTDITASSEIRATCKTSASEQMERWEDTKKLKDALPNEAFHEDVELEVNAEVMKEDSTCRSMIFKPEDDRCSNFFMAAFDAEVEATARGLQIIRNADLEERRELGSGNFGTVYHGKWKGSDVAIKRIKSSCFDGSPSVRERLKADFWKETGILAEMHHPNVVAFYGVVPDGPDGTLAMVTEFMVNGSLKHVLRKKIVRVLDPRRRLFIAMDSAFGMEYLHSKNIVHFDLKSENLFVNVRDPQRPICKVGDFGLSKVKQRTLVSGGFRGTLPWIAPELLNGSSMVTEKVDVYSFGIVMWELLTGEEPYADYHYGAVLGGILSDTLRPSVPEKCDPAWRLLMERCWSSDPINRPCFSEISSALRLMAASQLVKVQRPTQLQEGTGILQECVR